ncbi:hypothetical protein CXB51_034856 [Gossypium anomalum]|uniref:Aminotransferase-like plant mobile domain-containing protein n=1 Tax=Gossypium anomalum TaxID=47600 RepID=A0A8J5XX27_9ROSI|nr:hypothetical protein CXB51_034856 [Gossypium anomalum]
MFGLSSPLIENYLREAGFWHATTIGWGCKLDLKLISALIERWRPKTHKFHLPCGECTITLEDVQLQLGLPVDGSVLTGSVQSADWGAICYYLLGAIPDKFYRGQIEMGWLRDTFSEPGNDSTEVERIRYDRAYILEMIGGYLMPDLSRNLIHIGWLLKLIDFIAADELSWGSAVLATLYREMWNHPVSYIGIPTALEDIRLLLDQRSKAQFQWTPYEDPAIRAVILEEFFQNPNIWHVKVPLVLDEQYKIKRIRIGRYSGQNISKFGKTDPWQAIFAIGIVEASLNPCGKGTTGPFKSKENGLWDGPINSAHTITEPINSTHTITGLNASIDDTHITALLDYVKYVS